MRMSGAGVLRFRSIRHPGLAQAGVSFGRETSRPEPRGLRPVPYAVGVTAVGGVLGIPAGRWAGRAGKYCRRVNAEPVRAFFGCPLLPGNGKLAYICTANHSADGPEYETAASNNLQYPLGRASRCRLSRKQTPADGVLRRGEMERVYRPVPSRPGIFLRGGSGREVRPSGVEGTPGRASRKLHGRFRGRFRPVERHAFGCAFVLFGILSGHFRPGPVHGGLAARRR